MRLFDEKLAWEKPCGGGLTFKAYNQYPFLIENATPKRFVTETVLAAPNAGEASSQLDDPLLIYSRIDLNRMLLDRAEQAGAQLEKVRVLEMERSGAGWLLRTKSGVADADFCIVATGARNPLRDVGTQLTPPDTMSALGYYVPGEQTRIDIQFLPRLEGYIWIFPRCGHLSVGICGKGEPASSLRLRLERYMTERGLCWKGVAVLQPSAALARNRAPGARIAWRAKAGWRWAMRPAWSIPSPAKVCITPFARPIWRPARCSPKWAVWRKKLRTTSRCCAAISPRDLEFGSRLAKRDLSAASSCSDRVPARMVQFTRRSPRFSAVMQDLFAGKQPYLRLEAPAAARI